MPSIEDSEFGTILVRRGRSSSSIRASVTPDGRLRLSIPAMAPLFMAKRMVASSRSDLRKLLAAQPRLVFSDGMQIGKSHSLHIRAGETLHVRLNGQQIIATLGEHEAGEPAAQEAIRTAAIKALRKESKHYLPKRLERLAEQHGFSYSNVRFSHSSGRWGSCSAHGTISLNIALMNLPFEIIDYVILHELAHTRHMNHSSSFWQLVEELDPQYKAHRKLLKGYSPSV